ncbi:MAG: DMT family transporter [Ignavibacteriaceae bacterium]|nr:DMT family transporter [Ignavibacteriaceae bacterium]
MNSDIQPKTPILEAELILLLVALLWGGTFAMIKSVLADVSPMVFISMRFGLASVILFFLFRSSFSNLKKHHFTEGAVLGVLLFAGFITQTIGLKDTTATKSAFITGTFVVLTPIFQVIIERRMPSLVNIIGIIVVFTGIAFLSSSGSNPLAVITELGSNFTFGDFLTFLCAVFYALYIVYLDIISGRHDYRFLTFFQIAVTFFLSVASALIFDSSGIELAELTPNIGVVSAVLYTAIFATIITTLLQTRFQRAVTPTKAGIIFSFEPIFATIFAFFFLTEVPGLLGVIGGVLIVGGIIFTEVAGRKEQEKQ